MVTTETLSTAKKVCCFITVVLMIAIGISACSTEPKNTSSTGQGMQLSLAYSDIYSGNDNNTPSYYESIYEYSEQTSSIIPFVPPEIAPTVVTETNNEAPDGYKSVRITYMDENPINVDMFVPVNWAIEADNDEVVDFGGEFCNSISLYSDGKPIGAGYDAAFTTPDADDYTEIYHFIRWSHVNWLEDYREVRKDGKSAAALSTIYSWWPPSASDGLSGVSPDENGYYQLRLDAVLAYNKDVQKYVAFSFKRDEVPAEQLETIAKSIVLSAAEK